MSYPAIDFGDLWAWVGHPPAPADVCVWVGKAVVLVGEGGECFKPDFCSGPW